MPREKEDFRIILELINNKYPDKFLLSAKEVSEFLGISVRTVYRRFKFEGQGISKVKLARLLC